MFLQLKKTLHNFFSSYLVKLDLDLDPDPDPHSQKLPYPHKMNADPQPWIQHIGTTHCGRAGAALSFITPTSTLIFLKNKISLKIKKAIKIVLHKNNYWSASILQFTLGYSESEQQHCLERPTKMLPFQYKIINLCRWAALQFTLSPLQSAQSRRSSPRCPGYRLRAQTDGSPPALYSVYNTGKIR